jgi:hypothetical protein
MQFSKTMLMKFVATVREKAQLQEKASVPPARGKAKSSSGNRL